MKEKAFGARFCRKCLQNSLPVDIMIRFAQMVLPGYDIYKQSGFREGMPIPNQDAANRIVIDMIQSGSYVDFVESLLRIDSEGFMGRHYPLRGLDDVVNDIIQNGYSFDKTTGLFLENQQERVSLNWGRLNEGDEKQFTVLRLDIAGNSILVKENPRTKIEKAYSEMRTIVTKAVVSRLGRLWSWEGDGALAAFMFGKKERLAVFAGMDILHELFIFNLTGNPLNKPINVRIGINIGPVQYSKNMAECLKSETIKKAVDLEAKAAHNSLVISRSLSTSLDQALLNIFTPEKNGGRQYQAMEDRQ